MVTHYPKRHIGTFMNGRLRRRDCLTSHKDNRKTGKSNDLTADEASASPARIQVRA